MPEPPFALISDIHANLEALEAVLADIDANGVPHIVCLGDMVGYGPDPDRVVDLIRKRAGTVIAGNHDWALINRPIRFNRLAKEVIEYTKDLLEPKFYHLFGRTKERWDFLENLPEKLEEEKYQFVHGSLRDPLMDYCFGDRYPLWNPDQIDEIMSRVRWVCFCGHTHFPVVIDQGRKCWYPEKKDMRFTFERESKYIVNVGSVGQPRDGDPRASYAIFDGESIRYRRVEYDIEKTKKKILEIDELEKPLADRLSEGK